MRATIALGIAVLFALLGVSPVYFGGVMADAYYEGLEQWIPDWAFQVRSERYHRGWFSSTAHVELSLTPSLCDTPPCPVLQMQTQLTHGPIPFGATEALGGQNRLLGGVIQSTIDPAPLFRAGRIEPGLPPLKAFTKVYLTGSSSTRLEMPASGQTLQADSEQFSLASEGLLGVIDHRGASDLTTHFEMPRLEATGQQGRQALLKGISVDFSGSREGELLLGDWSGQLDRIRFLAPEEDARYALDALRLGASTRLRDGLISGDLNLTLDRLATPQQTVGASRGNIRFDRLDAATLVRIRNALRPVIRGEAPSPEARLAIAGLLMQYGPALLHPGPEITFNDLRLVTDRGVAAADGKLQVLPGAVDGRLTLGKLLRRLEGEADIVVDEPLARQWMDMSDRPDLASAQMPGLIEDNILQRTPDDQIAVNLEYKQGRLWINGIENEQWAALMVLLDMGSLEIDS
ncbi:DUF945 family protein [Abyssibacter profundi]|uniref:DUF945 domain-containing protein n=1 Tax=Abyssibacter profundi TaxID=2182787 RepID=A0A363UQQ1_9GAMM|nr:DUF945 family protein [Abyssibacter profundi]MBV61096.1 hypothetical protein [Nevskiales bacterium]PWN57829.1 hypothetical protein DEH80_01435 [Abyssibacter profundi]